MKLSNRGMIKTSAPTEKPAAEKKPELTSAQRNAVASAKSYLEIMPMSKDRLIQQLSSSAGDKYTEAQARYAASKAY